MVARSKKTKCRGCRRPIEDHEPVFRIAQGDMLDTDGEDFSEGTRWGFFHERCFLIVVGDPSGMMHHHGSGEMAIDAA